MKRPFSWLAVALFAFPLIAQSPQQPPLNPSAASLPPNFTGTDFAAVYRALSIAPKDEFETTAQYEARKQQLPTGIYAFKVPPMGPVIYDADQGKFEAKAFIDFAHRGSTSSNGGLLVLSRESVGGGSHQATNAFGATTTVRTYTNTVSGLLVPQSFNIVNLQVPVAAEKAREIKDRLAVLAVAEIGPQSVPARLSSGATAAMRDATGYTSKDATLESPTDVTTYEHAIDAKVLGLWVYDTASGEILGKFDLDGKRLDAGGTPVKAPAAPLPPATSGADVFHRVSRGMTIEEVRALSAPLTPQIIRKGDTEEWRYPDKVKLRFKAGKLVNTSAGVYWDYE